METIFSFIMINSEAIFLFAFFSLLYLLLANFKIQKNGVSYFWGLLLMVTSLFLSTSLSTSMPFTVHMSVHILLLLICAPLMVIGWPTGSGAHPSWFDSLSSFLVSHPLLCWITGIGIMWFWHIPKIVDALMSTHHQAFSLISLSHYGSLLIAGFIFAWPILNTHKGYQVDPPIGIVYLFTACIACSLLGMLITFAPPEIYRMAMGMNTNMPMDGIDVNTASDQQAAGLMMWVPCCFLYLFGVLYLALKWLKEPNKQLVNEHSTALSSNIPIPESHD